MSILQKVKACLDLGSYHLITILLLGFVSGLTFMLLVSTIPYQLAEAQYPTYVIGDLSWITLPYALKMLWAPLVDRYSISFLCNTLGQRRGWLIFVQFLLLLAIGCLTFVYPIHNLCVIIIITIIIAFLGAIQDILVEAYRIEIAPTKQALALAITCNSVGYGLGRIVGSGGMLFIAAKYGWDKAYSMVFLLLWVGPIAILFVKASLLKKGSCATPTCPSASYFGTIRSSLMALRNGRSYLLFAIFLFMVTYKASDSITMTMRDPLCLWLKFTKLEIAMVTKTYGAIMAIIGGLASGILTIRLGLFRSVLITSMAQLLSPLMFLVLSLVGHHMPLFIATITIQNFFSGLSGTVLITYLSSLCNGSLRATQFAVLSSLGALARIVLSSVAGHCKMYMTWPYFFGSVILLGMLPMIIFPGYMGASSAREKV